MNEEFVKNIVMNAKFDPKVVIRIPNRDPFFVTQYLETHTASSDQDMKKLMSLRVHVMMQCCMRQLSADRYWLHEPSGGHASWRTSMRKFTKESTTHFCTKTEDVCADGTFRRGIQNQMKNYARQRPWRATLKSMRRKVGKEFG